MEKPKMLPAQRDQGDPSGFVLVSPGDPDYPQDWQLQLLKGAPNIPEVDQATYAKYVEAGLAESLDSPAFLAESTFPVISRPKLRLLKPHK